MPEPFTEEYQVDYYKVNHKIFDEFHLVIGDHVWKFADFETAPVTKWVNGNKKAYLTNLVSQKWLLIIWKKDGILYNKGENIEEYLVI